MDGVELTGLQKKREGQPLAPLTPEQMAAFRTSVETFATEVVDAGVHFHAPPFSLPDKPTPENLAEALTFVFYKFAGLRGPRLSLTWRLVSAFATGKPELALLKETGERIAADYDRGIGDRPENSYHNAQHAFEVLCCAHILALLKGRSGAPLSPENRLLLLIAALIHDWHHDGSPPQFDHPEQYFEQEDRTLRLCEPYFSGLNADQIARLALMIRSTDLSGPHAYAARVLDWHMHRLLGDGDDDPPPPSPPDRMAALADLLKPTEIETGEMAAMLRDANVLPLAGLTPDYATVCSQRLAEEWAHPVGHDDFMIYVRQALSRRHRPTDMANVLAGTAPDHVIAFASQAGDFFTPNLHDVVDGHAALMEEMGLSQQRSGDSTIDLSAFQEARDDMGGPVAPSVTLEAIATLRATLSSAGFFDAPPFTLTLRSVEKLIPGTPQDLLHRINLAEHTDDALQRLHTIGGPLISAVIAHLFDTIGLRIDDPVYRAAAGIAREIDQGIGAGTADDQPDAESNPYHNRKHILDIVLLSDLLGQRATQRAAPASSPLARGLLLLAALVCHWHHTGKGNKIDGEYRTFYLQDRALEFSRPHTTEMSKELRQSLEILVRSTDPRDAYNFSRAAYAFQVGLGARPEIPGGCESLARLLGDPALCTLAARLNDILYVPFVGLGSAYSARSIVQLGREIGQVIDFNFVRTHLVAPMLSRPLYPGEQPHPALLVHRTKVASFTSAEAQAIFNPALQALLVAAARKS